MDIPLKGGEIEAYYRRVMKPRNMDYFSNEK